MDWDARHDWFETENVTFLNEGISSMDNPFCVAPTSMRSRADSFRNAETPRAPAYRLNK